MRCKFLSLNQQTTCVDISFSTRCPYAIVLSIDRWIKEEIFLISKEYSFQDPDFKTTQKFFATVEAFLLCCIGKHLCWNASIGRQMQVNFCYFSNRTSADCQLLGDVTCTFASPRLVLLRSDQFINLRNVGSSSHASRPSTASLSINC